MNMMMIHSLTESVGWTLLHFVWQCAIAVVVLWILLRVLTEKSAQVRYLLSCSVLLLLAAGSGLTLFLHLDFSSAHEVSKAIPKAFRTEHAQPVDIRLLEPNERPQIKFPEEIATSHAPVVITPPPEKSVSIPERLSRILSPWLSWIVGFWMAGVVILSIRLMNSWRMARNMVHSGKPLEDSEWEQRFESIKQQLKISYPVRLLTSASTSVPVVIGWLKPTVLLPGSVLTGLHPDQLEAILYHELAHIRRHDYLVNILQNVMEILFFYHPGLKWISRQVRLERECCCDEIAAQHSGGAVYYVKALTAMIQLHPEQPAAPALAASGSSLLTRIKRLIKSEQSDLADAPGSGILMTVLFAALILLPLIFSLSSEDVNAEIKPKDSLNKKEDSDSKPTPENKTEEDNSEYKGEGRISGEIVFEDGTPANVEGALYGYSKRGNSSIHSTIESKTTKLDNTFSAGKVWIKFYPKGYAPSWAGPFDLKKDQEIKRVKLVLKKGFSSTLKLTSEKGEPIPDAIVFKYPVIKTDKHHEWRGGPNYELKTDQQGLLKLEQLSELPYDLTITAPGYETLRERDITPKANETFTLKMTPAEPTTGTVFNHDGSPAPDAKLYLRIEMNNLKHDNRSYTYGSGNIATTTDENGKFILDQLSRKCRYRFIVELKDGSRFVLDDLLPGSKNNKLTAPAPKELKIRLIGDLDQITLRKGKRVIDVRQRSRFQVVEDENYGDLIYDSVPVTPTVDGGEVTWKGILPGKAVITAGDTQKEVEIKETGVTEVFIRLKGKETGKISGEILFEDGTPADVEGALNASSRYFNSTIQQTLDWKTSQLDHYVHAGKVWIFFYPKDHATTWAGPFDLKAGQNLTGVKLIVKKGFSSTLKLTSEQGEPIPNATVAKYPVFKTDRDDNSGVQYSLGGGPVKEMKTDQQGELKLEHLAEVPYDFRITAPGHEPLVKRDVSIKPDETISWKMIPTELTTGTVLNHDGSSASEAKIRLINHAYIARSSGWAMMQPVTTTDKNGNFEIDQLSLNSSYRLMIEMKDGSRFLVDDLTPGSKNRKLTAPVPKELKIRLIGSLDQLRQAKGRPVVIVIQQIQFQLSTGVDSIDEFPDIVPVTPTKDGGEAIWKGILPGKAVITAGDIQKEVVINESGVTEVTIELPEKKKIASAEENKPETNQNADTQKEQQKSYPSDPTLPAPEKVIEQLEKAVGTIQNFDVYVTGKHQMLLKLVSNENNNPIYREFKPDEEKPEVEHSYYRQAFNPPMTRRLEIFQSPFKNPESIIIINKGFKTTYKPEKGSGSIRTFHPDMVPVNDVFGGFYQDSIWISQLTFSLKDRKAIHVKRDPDHPHMIVIDAPPVNFNIKSILNVLGFRFWLDSKGGMRPIQIEVYVKTDGGQERITFRRKYEYSKNRNNLIVPSRIVHQTLARNGELKGEPFIETELKVDMERSRWNVDLEEDLFTLRFPKGTAVEDRVRDLRILTGPNGSKATLEELEKTAQNIKGLNLNGMHYLDQKNKENKQTNLLKYDDNSPDGKKSIAGTGHLIRFSLPEKSQQLKGLSIHAARYGYPKAPEEDVEVSVVSDDETDLIHTELVPYSRFERGESRWHEIEFEDPIDVPEHFKVILNFNPEKTKGVYVSYDTSTERTHSKTALPGAPSQDLDFKGDWMIHALLTQPEQN